MEANTSVNLSQDQRNVNTGSTNKQNVHGFTVGSLQRYFNGLESKEK